MPPHPRPTGSTSNVVPLRSRSTPDPRRAERLLAARLCDATGRPPDSSEIVVRRLLAETTVHERTRRDPVALLAREFGVSSSLVERMAHAADDDARHDDLPRAG